jgi:hypothetical protein
VSRHNLSFVELRRRKDFWYEFAGFCDDSAQKKRFQIYGDLMIEVYPEAEQTLENKKAKRRYNMQPFQQRVIDEKLELDEKITKLAAFRTTSLFDSIDPSEQSRMTDQEVTMREYSRILGERITFFQEANQNGK